MLTRFKSLKYRISDLKIKFKININKFINICVSLFLCCGFQVRHRWCELVVKHAYTQAYGDVEHFLVYDQVNTVFDLTFVLLIQSSLTLIQPKKKVFPSRKK